MQPTRFAELSSGLVALTATARGMIDHNMNRAAHRAFHELMPAVSRAGLMDQVRSCISMVPDIPQGTDDPNCRFVAGVVFGFAMEAMAGRCTQPELPLSGSLAWWPIAAGRFAVFTHIGPYFELHGAWARIYNDWLPASGEVPRDAAPMELSLNDPKDTPPEQLHTELWVPIR